MFNNLIGEKMIAGEYDNQLSAYQAAIQRRRQLLMIIRMNKVWGGSGMGKKAKHREAKIAKAELQLAQLVIPPKPVPVIRGFQIYELDGTFGGFVNTQDQDEAAHKAGEFYGSDQFTMKAIFTNDRQY